MTTLSYTLPVVGNPFSTEAPKVGTALQTISSYVNGRSIDASNLSVAVAQQLGLSDGTSVRRGYVNIPTSESRGNAVYGVLTTPDQVTVVLPSGGLIFVAYQALWQESVDGAARAAIFLNSNQLLGQRTGVATLEPNEASCTGNANIAVPLATSSAGLIVPAAAVNTSTPAPATTGQLVADTNVGTGGGPACIFAAAGSYTVGIRFKASSGTVTVSNRQLWVWTKSF